MSNLHLATEEQELFNICKINITEDYPAYQLEGIKPKFIAQPSTDEETAQILNLAARSKTPLAVAGNRTKFAYGSPLKQAEWVLSTTSLVSEPIITAEDLMVVTKAGMPLAELQAQLREKGLYLPIDAGTNGSTVGGALAQGGGSSHRLSYGLIRDMVLGLKIALTDGKVYKFGGQTVKNVTGYDLRKLLIGSQGTLGVITEACLRVYAIPPASKVITAAAKNRDQAFAIADNLKELRPVVLEIYDQSTAMQLFNQELIHDGYLLAVKFSGPTPLVDKKYRQTKDILAKWEAVILQELSGLEDNELWDERTDFFQENEQRDENDICRVKISLPLKETFSIAQSLEAVFKENRTTKSSLYMPGVGLIYFKFYSPDTRKLLTELQKIVLKTKGFAILEKGPVDLRKDIYADSWTDWDLRVKRFFDPETVLNPGKRP